MRETVGEFAVHTPVATATAGSS